MVRDSTLSPRQAYRYLQQARHLKQPLPVSDAKVAFTVKLSRQLVKQVRTRAQDAGLSLSEFVGQAFNYVITVCDNAKETCPVFPATTKRIHWSIEDPAAAQGSEEGRLAEFRRVRDELRARLRSFVDHQAKK